MKLTEWIDLPGNAERYRKWTQSKITSEILNALKEEIEPDKLPAWQITGESALYISGKNVGENRVVKLLQSLDEMREPGADELFTDYRVDIGLKEAGYTDAEIQRIMQRELTDG